MKNLEKKGPLDNEIVITEDNIEKLSRIIALSALKNIRKYAYSSVHFIESLRKQLQADICYRKTLDAYSEAYDVVQEASCFLCNFLGHKLGKMCIKSKTRINRMDSIRYACFQAVSIYLRKEMKHGQCEDEEALEYVESNDNYFKEPEDYSKVKQIANKLVTDNLDKRILNYYYDGVQPKFIAEFLNIKQDAVYDRRKKFKRRYMAYCV